jgi:hypothetical protein
MRQQNLKSIAKSILYSGLLESRPIRSLEIAKHRKDATCSVLSAYKGDTPHNNKLQKKVESGIIKHYLRQHFTNICANKIVIKWAQ